MSYDLKNKRGDTWQGAVFEILLNDEPLDLTDSAILMQIKKSSSDDDYLKQFSTDDASIVITNASAGKFEIPETIIDIAPRIYVYDVQISLSSGRVLTPVSGTFEITADVTR